MDISKGQVAAVAIIIAVLVQGLGGFLANADTQTSCVSQFDYLTDVYGSFDGSRQDIPVDYNPRENITGYYSYDYDNQSQEDLARNAKAIIFDDGPANNYPYKTDPLEVKRFTITILCDKIRDYDDWDDSPERYFTKVVMHGEDGDEDLGTIMWNGSEDEDDPSWYSGVYHESLGHLTNFRTEVLNTMYQGPRIVNIQEMYRQIEENLHHPFNGEDLSISCPAEVSFYPTFVGGTDLDKDVSWDHRTITLEYANDPASYMYYNKSTSTAEIHANTYEGDDQWLVFGDTFESSIDLEVVLFEVSKNVTYIDPAKGVQPAHQAQQYAEKVTNWYFPTELYGTLNRDGNDATFGAPLGQNYRFAMDLAVLGMDPSDPQDPVPDENGIYQPADPAMMFRFARIIVEANGLSTAAAVFRVTLTDLGTGESIWHEWQSASRSIHITCNWSVTHDNGFRIDFSERVLGGEVTLTGDPDWSHDSHVAFQFFNLMPNYDYIEPPSDPDTPLRLYAQLSDVYPDGGPSPDAPVSRDYDGWRNQFAVLQLQDYQKKHEVRIVSFSSDATYWNNGYGDPTKDPEKSGNGNSLIGMVLETRPLTDGMGHRIRTETPFNLSLHYQDPSTGEYKNVWLYNNPLQKALSVWTDLDSDMVYVGHYDSAGTRQDATAVKVGVCNHIYLELRVDNGILRVSAAPIYGQNFKSFLEFTPGPQTDCTDAVIGILPVDHPHFKSIAQMSFNVQPMDMQEGEVVETWTSGDCTVTLYTTGLLKVTGEGMGMMEDYDYDVNPENGTGNSEQPWLAAHSGDIRSVFVGNGVKHIGNGSFLGTNAEKAYIGDMVESVGEQAFQMGGRNLGSVVIGAGVDTIGRLAFFWNWGCKSIAFTSSEWHITAIGENAFILHNTFTPGNCIVYSPDNMADGRLDDFAQAYNSFTYEAGTSREGYPVYPRQLVVKTIILLDGGGLYVQDGVFHPNLDYPNSPLAELVINAVVHPGGQVTLSTTDDGGNSTLLLTMYNDGVDKWISFKKADGGYLWEGQKFDWWDVHIYYVSNKIGGVDIEDVHYGPQMYLPDGTQLAQNHVYVQAGKYGTIEDIGAMVNDEHGMSDLTVRMGGVWAFSTQFSNGTNIQGSHVKWGGSAWTWDMNATLTVFALTMLMASIVLFYKFGYNIYDILLLGGSLALLWVSFQG